MEQAVKVSKYTTWWSIDNNRYLFCTRSGAIAKVNAETEAMILTAQSTADIIDAELKSFLITKGILVPKDIDEFGSYRHMAMAEQFNSHPKRISLTIAVTEKCNYHCKYCFESNTMMGIEMSEETAAGIISYIQKTISSQKEHLKEIHITWFGGEPIMALGIIESISKPIIEMCEKCGICYSASVISNGSLVNASAANILLRSKVSFMQITLDGEKEISCKYKGSSQAAYENSILAIILLSKHIRVSIRLNTDGENIDSILRAVDSICKKAEQEGVLGNIQFYLAAIDTPEQAQFPTWFVDAHNKFLEFLCVRGMKTDIEFALPKARFSSCGAVCDSNIYINADGTMTKCEHYLGDSTKVIGNVWNGLWHNSEEFRFRDINIDDKCRDCGFYPICRQGCLAKRLDNDAQVDCLEFRRNIFNILRHLTHIG